MSSEQPIAGVHYSDAYAKLVRDDDDLVGALAYSLYKRQKRELIVALGLARDDPRVVNYHQDLNDTRLQALRGFAETKLTDYADRISEEVLRSEAEKVRTKEMLAILLSDSDDKRRLFDKTAQQLRDQIDKGTAWWKNIIWSAVGGFVLALVLTLANVVQWTNPLLTGNGGPGRPAPALSDR